MSSGDDQAVDATFPRIECSMRGCSLKFRNVSEYQRHSRVHTGVRPFPCPDCPKAFARKACLKRHQAVHLTAKPFKCEHCPKTFTFKFSCIRHEKLHSGARKAAKRARAVAKNVPMIQDLVSDISSASSDSGNSSGLDSGDEAAVACATRPAPAMTAPPPPPPAGTIFVRQYVPVPVVSSMMYPMAYNSLASNNNSIAAANHGHSHTNEVACPDCGRCFASQHHFEQHWLVHVAIRALEAGCPPQTNTHSTTHAHTQHQHQHQRVPYYIPRDGYCL